MGMNYKPILIGLLTAILTFWVGLRLASADDGIQFAKHTVSVPSVIQDGVAQALLANNPAPDAGYYAITNYTTRQVVTVVSVAALRQEADPQAWNLDDAIWLGTVALSGDTFAVTGSQEYSALTQDVFYGDLPANRPGITAEGGEDGPYLDSPMLPFKPGTRVIFGTRGVHPAGYSRTGWVAVDLVSGSDLGATAATNEVYGAKDEEITYVCRDNNSIAVLTDTFIYAHMVDNPALQEGYNIRRGVMFGTMVVGSFTDSCGWASQQPNHWHLHFGMNGTQTVDFLGWTFRPYEEAFVRGGTVVRKNEWLNNPGVVAGDDVITDPGAELSGANFWDGIVVALVNYLKDGALTLFPERSETNLQDAYINSSGAILRVFFIMLKTSFSLAVFGFVVGVMFVLEPARVIYKLYIAVKKAIPFA